MTQERYKTEEQLKAEVRARRAAEAKTIVAVPKTVAQKKREHFWYYYKWHSVGSILLAVLLVFFIQDTFFQKMPDATIILVSKEYISDESVDRLAAEIGKIASEGGEQAYIIIDRIVLSEDAADYASAMKLTTVLAAGIDLVYLLDSAAYQYISEMGKGILAAGGIPVNIPSSEFDGMRFYLRSAEGKGSDYYEYCKNLLKKIEANKTSIAQNR